MLDNRLPIASRSPTIGSAGPPATAAGSSLPAGGETPGARARSSLAEWLASHPARRVPRGRFLYFSGQPARSLFAVRGGLVKTTRPSLSGDEIIVSLHQRGEFFGTSCLRSATRGEQAVALEASEVVEVSRDVVLAHLRCAPDAALELIAALSGRLDEAVERLESLTSAPVLERLVQTLLALSRRLAVDVEPGVALIGATLTQQELGQLISARREVVSALLNGLRSRGLIAYTRKGRIRVHDAALGDYLRALRTARE